MDDIEEDLITIVTWLLSIHQLSNIFRGKKRSTWSQNSSKNDQIHSFSFENSMTASTLTKSMSKTMSSILNKTSKIYNREYANRMNICMLR